MSKLPCRPLLWRNHHPGTTPVFNKKWSYCFRVINPETVRLFISETDRIEREWLAEGRDKINGVPLKFGQDEAGNP